MRTGIFILLFSLTLGLPAQELEKTFTRAEKLYRENKFEEALHEYQNLEKHHYAGKELYYNMGNCYYKTAQNGMAIAYYEKALKYDPADEDILANLRLVNSKTEDKINEEEKGLSAWFIRFLHVFSADKWTRLGLMLWLVGFLGFILFKVNFIRSKLQLKILSWVCVSLGVFSLLLGYLNYRRVNRHSAVVITAPMVQVKSSPSESSKNLYILHEGAKINLHDTNNGWYEVSIDNENYGWVKKEEAVII